MENRILGEPLVLARTVSTHLLTRNRSKGGIVTDDPYAFCYQIEKEAAAAFDKAGLAAFEKQVRERFDAASADPSNWTYRRGAEILRAIYIAQCEIDAYIALAEQTELKPEDCLSIAKLLVTCQGRRSPRTLVLHVLLIKQ